MFVPTLLLASLLLGAAHDDNPILKQLVDAGVPVGSGAPLKLPPPTLPDGLDAAAQKKAIQGIADANHPVDALLRKSIVSPFQLIIRSEGNATGDVTGKRVDIWCVVYGDLSTITKEGFLEERFSLGSKGESNNKPAAKSVILSAEELKKRNIQIATAADAKEGFAYASFSLFDRVQISGTGHVYQTRTKTSVLMASLLAPGFADDADFANRWAAIDRDKEGNFKVGAPHPYAGYGSYVKVTELIEPSGALFVEYHLVFDEPKAWFSGANLLRSKLPLMVQDNIRKFRREVASEAH
ncbi:MAG TPA: hypothetical protein VGN12_09515 [Pirellulales bacterium]|jgi:hypothetical protein